MKESILSQSYDIQEQIAKFPKIGLLDLRHVLSFCCCWSDANASLKRGIRCEKKKKPSSCGCMESRDSGVEVNDSHVKKQAAVDKRRPP